MKMMRFWVAVLVLALTQIVHAGDLVEVVFLNAKWNPVHKLMVGLDTPTTDANREERMRRGPKIWEEYDKDKVERAGPGTFTIALYAAPASPEQITVTVMDANGHPRQVQAQAVTDFVPPKVDGRDEPPSRVYRFRTEGFIGSVFLERRFVQVGKTWMTVCRDGRAGIYPKTVGTTDQGGAGHQIPEETLAWFFAQTPRREGGAVRATVLFLSTD